MAPPIGTEDFDVMLAEARELLFAEPYAFDFFQAVRLLERLQPERAPIGSYSHPQNEVVRIGANPTLSFPASAIQTLEEQPGSAPKMMVNFMGLVGPLGVLPNYFTELTAERRRAKDKTLLEFYDLFTHRLASLFYRAWDKNHFSVSYERDRSDEVTKIIYALIGFGTPGIRNRQPVDDESFLHYSGLFGLTPQSAVALESILADHFDVPVEIEPFIGTWRSLEEPDQCVFGDGRAGGSDEQDSTTLGFGAVVGDEIWDRQSRVRIQIGPLDAAQYADFLPTGSAWPHLKSMVRTFSGNDLEFEVQLILRREDVPVLELHAPEDGSMSLGWHTWLKSKARFNRDPSDTILILGEA